jgi:Flp pilus assembly protein TadD
MILPLLLALAAQTVAPATAPPDVARILADAAHSISAGRLNEARLIISRAVAAGADGQQVERLLADLAFESGNYADALTRYQHLRAESRNDSIACERAGIAALKIGEAGKAAVMIECATAVGDASWRAWNARGVLADLNHDTIMADKAYEHASRLSPNEAEVVNNQGWSQLLRGDWARAAELLERATALDPGSTRIANNLELAHAALDSDLPRRRPQESDQSWAARLNDVGVAAQLRGNRQRAVAAFTQALDASGSWYLRAANNLAAASKP